MALFEAWTRLFIIIFSCGKEVKKEMQISFVTLTIYFIKAWTTALAFNAFRSV